MPRIYSDNPEDEFRRLRSSGAGRLPRDPIRNRVDGRDMYNRARTGSMSEDLGQAFDLLRRSEGRDSLNNGGFRGMSAKNLATAGPDALDKINDMHRQRTANPGSMGNSQVAWPKMRDPFETFREKAWWFLKEGEFSESLKKVREWARLVYMTHPLIPSLVDIYSRFPLLDIEFKHKDKKLAEYYNELFLNQLNYQDFLYDMSREHWLVGEAFPLGSWNEGIGTWDDDELLNPDDVLVSRNTVLRQYKYHLKVPEGIKKLIETRQPRQEYEMLMKFYPHVISWAQENKEIPVSDVLLKHIKFKVNPWEPHGVPLIMRGFKTLMLEMSLEAAQDAVADRLYSPMILAKLGIEDVGDNEGPWIPEPEELDSLRDDLSLALMSDFRLMVYHHGLNIESVFGREAMPRFDMDFERVDMKLMQIFGIGPELLQGGNSSAPYASGALNRELITQMLTTHQIGIKRFLHDRMAVVAERQGHFEFEKRGTQRYPVFEQVLMVDELTGEEYVEERPKLAIPEANLRVMNLRDETVERQFLMDLKNSGVPVSDDALMTNVSIDFDDEVSKLQKEKMDKVLAELHYQKRLFVAIFVNHLPVPPEYWESYLQFLQGMQSLALTAPGTDITDGTATPNLFPMIQPSTQDMEAAQMAGAGQRSPESDSGRSNMPKKSSSKNNDGTIDDDVQTKGAYLLPPEYYAPLNVRNDFIALGTEGWMRKHGMWLEMPDTVQPVNIDDEEEDISNLPIDKTAFSTVYSKKKMPKPDEEALLAARERAGSIAGLGSPSHMAMRRKMIVPDGTIIKEAIEAPIESEGEDELEQYESTVETEGTMLGEDDES